MTRSTLSILSLMALALMPALAQETPAEEAETRLDTVQVTGTHPFLGDAMAAFNVGDYEAAEVEFKDVYANVTRVLNQEQAAYILARQTDLIDTGTQGSLSSGTRSDTQGAMVSTTATSNARWVALSNVAAETRVAGRTVRFDTLDRQDLAFPLYMTGLSQIQLGKYDEARKSLYRSATYDRTVPDTRFRIGLLELRAGRLDKAEKQLRALEKMTRRCAPNCIDDAGNDTLANLELLRKGIEQYKAGELFFN